MFNDSPEIRGYCFFYVLFGIIFVFSYICALSLVYPCRVTGLDLFSVLLDVKVR